MMKIKYLFICVLGLEEREIYVIINAKNASKILLSPLVWVEDHNFCYPHKSSKKKEKGHKTENFPSLTSHSPDEKGFRLTPKIVFFLNLKLDELHNKQVFLSV